MGYVEEGFSRLYAGFKRRLPGNDLLGSKVPVQISSIRAAVYERTILQGMGCNGPSSLYAPPAGGLTCEILVFLRGNYA